MDSSAAISASYSHRQTTGRQGLCHISQLLELLFLKYGISTEELDLVSAGEAQVASRDKKTLAAADGREDRQRATSTNATASLAATSPETAQTTFAWFQPSDLTI